MSKGILVGCGVVVLGAILLLAVAGMGSYNRLVVARREGAERVGPGRERVSAPQRPHPQPGRDGEGRRQVRARDLHRGHRGARQGRPGDDVGRPENAEQLQQFQQAQDQLSSALSRLMVVVERYPELKATEAFRDLQAQLEGTENRIAVERMRFNEVARDYNTARRRFPTVLIASIMGFDARPYFEAEQGADQPPPVKF